MTDFKRAGGDSFDIVVTVDDGDPGNPQIVPITDAAAIDWVCQKDGATVLTKSLADGGITITNGAMGQFTVEITSGDSAAWNGDFVHAARIIDANGDTQTVRDSRFTMTPNRFI